MLPVFTRRSLCLFLGGWLAMPVLLTTATTTAAADGHSKTGRDMDVEVEGC